MEIREAALTAVLDLDDDTEHAILSGVRADPATAGRITVRFPVEDVPRQARIAGVLIHCGDGSRFRRWFTPHLTVPPGGVLSVSFGVEDVRLRLEARQGAMNPWLISAPRMLLMALMALLT